MIFTFLKISVLAFIACLVILPIWLYFTYKSRQQSNAYLNSQDSATIQELNDQVRSLNARIAELEALLDYQNPEWRNNNHQN